MEPDRSTATYKAGRMPVALLVPYARNSRTHKKAQVAQLASAIRRFGFTNPVLVDEAGGIIAGHGRTLAAQQVGLEEIPVVHVVGLTEDEKRALVIADNQLALNSGWDKQMLASELTLLKDSGFDMSLMGFAPTDLHALVPGQAKDGLTHPDELPETARQMVSVPGDVWHLGAHRVICGDSCAGATWETLMGGEQAALCWTDPPYNVAYKTELAGSIQNDDLSDAEFLRFLTSLMSSVYARLQPGGAIYVAHADTEGLNFRKAFIEAGFKLSGCLIWRKDSLVLGRSDYQWMHEPILYGWKPGAAHRWFGGRKQTTVVEHGAAGPIRQREDGRWVIEVGDSVLVVDGKAKLECLPSSLVVCERPRRSADHPTMKPVALIEK